MNDLIATFNPNQTAALTGLTTAQLTHWHRSHVFVPGYVDPTRWLGYSRYYSYRDLVALRVLRELRETHHVPLAQLRVAGKRMRERYTDPWSSLKFWVLEHMVVFTESELSVYLSAVQPWQQVLPYEFEMAPILSEMAEKVEQFRRRDPRTIGHIARSPRIMSGQYVVEGTRVTTASIFAWHTAGASIERIQQAYPDLMPDDIRVAIEHEQEKKPARGRRMTRSA